VRGIPLALFLAVVGCTSRGLPSADDIALPTNNNDLGPPAELGPAPESGLSPGLGPDYVDEVVRACVIAAGCSLPSLPWHPLASSASKNN